MELKTSWQWGMTKHFKPQGGDIPRPLSIMRELAAAYPGTPQRKENKNEKR